jgi:hypothetical protein
MLKPRLPGLCGLPTEIIHLIFELLPINDILSIAQISEKMSTKLDIRTISLMFQKDYNALQFDQIGQLLWTLLDAYKYLVANELDSTLLFQTAWRILGSIQVEELLILPILCAKSCPHHLTLLKWIWDQYDSSSPTDLKPIRTRPVTLLPVGKLLLKSCPTDQSIVKGLIDLLSKSRRGYVVEISRNQVNLRKRAKKLTNEIRVRKDHTILLEVSNLEPWFPLKSLFPGIICFRYDASMALDASMDARSRMRLLRPLR